MAPITLASKYAPDTTSISNIFLDKYMPNANGEFVKVYLCLVRMFSDPGMRKPTLDELADQLGLTERDINRALKYWESVGLLNIEYDGAYPVSIILLPVTDDSASKTSSIPVHHQEAMTKYEQEVMTKPESARYEQESIYVPTQATASISTPVSSEPAPPKKTVKNKADVMVDATFKQITFVTEQLLGVPLSRKDVETLQYIYDALGFSEDLIEYLIEYCVSNGKRSFRYIEKVALAWKDENIVTVAEAKNAHEIHNKKVYSVMRAFGLDDRQPGKPEMDFITKWYDDYGFENEVILEACNRTIQSIHKPSFEYADSILKNWKQKNIHTVSDINAMDTTKPKRTYMTTITVAGQNDGGQDQGAAPVMVTTHTPGVIISPSSKSKKFTDFSQRSYDYAELEKQLIGKKND